MARFFAWTPMNQNGPIPIQLERPYDDDMRPIFVGWRAAVVADEAGSIHAVATVF